MMHNLDSYVIFGRRKSDGNWIRLYKSETRYRVRGEPVRKKFLFWEYNSTPIFTVYADKEEAVRVAWDKYLSHDYQDVVLEQGDVYYYENGTEVNFRRIWINGEWV